MTLEQRDPCDSSIPNLGYTQQRWQIRLRLIAIRTAGIISYPIISCPLMKGIQMMSNAKGNEESRLKVENNMHRNEWVGERERLCVVEKKERRNSEFVVDTLKTKWDHKIAPWVFPPISRQLLASMTCDIPLWKMLSFICFFYIFTVLRKWLQLMKCMSGVLVMAFFG